MLALCISRDKPRRVEECQSIIKRKGWHGRNEIRLEGNRETFERCQAQSQLRWILLSEEQTASRMENESNSKTKRLSGSSVT